MWLSPSPRFHMSSVVRLWYGERLGIHHGRNGAAALRHLILLFFKSSQLLSGIAVKIRF